MTAYLLVTWKFFVFQQITPNNWGIILLISATTGSGAIFMYYYGLRKVSAIASTILELFFPISAVIFDYFFNGTKLSEIQWIAVACMLFCIFMMNKKQLQKATVKK
jgi:drug/metabolite transporter (DMT)-like permease